MSKEIDDLKIKLESFEDNLKQSEVKNDTLKNEMKDLNDKNAAFQADLDKREKRMDFAKKKIENQDQEIKDLNNMVKQKDNEILDLKADVNDHKSVTEEKEKLAKEMDEKDADIKILQENNQKLENKFKALTKINKSLRIANNEREKVRIQAEQEKNGEIKALNEQYINMKQLFKNAEKNLKIQKKEINELLRKLNLSEASGSGRISHSQCGIS